MGQPLRCPGLSATLVCCNQFDQVREGRKIAELHTMYGVPGGEVFHDGMTYSFYKSGVG